MIIKVAKNQIVQRFVVFLCLKSTITNQIKNHLTMEGTFMLLSSPKGP